MVRILKIREYLVIRPSIGHSFSQRDDDREVILRQFHDLTPPKRPFMVNRASNMARMWQILPFRPCLRCNEAGKIFDMKQGLGRIDSTRHKRNSLSLLPHQVKFMTVLDPKDVVEGLDGWTGGDDFITKVFRFDDFAQAFGWMTRIAITRR